MLLLHLAFLIPFGVFHPRVTWHQTDSSLASRNFMFYYVCVCVYLYICIQLVGILYIATMKDNYV